MVSHPDVTSRRDDPPLGSVGRRAPLAENPRMEAWKPVALLLSEQQRIASVAKHATLRRRQTLRKNHAIKRDRFLNTAPVTCTDLFHTIAYTDALWNTRRSEAGWRRNEELARGVQEAGGERACGLRAAARCASTSSLLRCSSSRALSKPIASVRCSPNICASFWLLLFR